MFSPYEHVLPRQCTAAFPVVSRRYLFVADDFANAPLQDASSFVLTLIDGDGAIVSFWTRSLPRLECQLWSYDSPSDASATARPNIH